MATSHHISHATSLFYGPAFDGPIFAENGRKGVPFHPITKVNLGEPIAADADYLVKGATSTELLGAAGTATWTTDDDGSSPFDNADTPAVSTISTATGESASVWELDVPRNISINVTHSSAVVAMSFTVTGYDAWGYKLAETFSITASGTTKTAAGKKAFAAVESISYTVAASVQANTVNVGIGDVLGLPYKAAAKADVLRVFFDDAADDSATVVAAVTTEATATTGDVRGTVDPDSACDGSEIAVWMYVDPSSAATLRGVDQYAG